MPNFDKNIFKKQFQQFYKVKKRILQKRPLSANSNKINEYITLLIQNYNSIIEYTTIHLNTLSNTNELTSYLAKIRHCRIILIKCFDKLQCKIKIPEEVNLLECVDRSVMIDTDFKYSSEGKQNINSCNSSGQGIEMATIEQKKHFITMCASIIRENYDGNPLTLQSFLDKINLIEDLTEPTLQNTFLNFVKSKLDAKAREALPENISTINEIKIALRNGIKPESSKIVAGRIAALSVKDSNYVDFAKHAEELADALKRSLVIEGMTRDKAHEMAVEQTVSVCRLNAKSDLVKSILASSTFSDPREVIAKLVVEQANEAKEKQVLAIRQYNNRGSSFQQAPSFSYSANSFRYGNIRGNSRGRNYQRGNNHSFGNYRNQSNHRNDNYRNQSNYRNDSYRNQSNYRDDSNRNQLNYRNDNGQRSSQNGNNQRPFVRLLNSEAPQQALREEENQI